MPAAGVNKIDIRKIREMISGATRSCFGGGRGGFDTALRRAGSTMPYIFFFDTDFLSLSLGNTGNTIFFRYSANMGGAQSAEATATAGTPFKPTKLLSVKVGGSISGHKLYLVGSWGAPLALATTAVVMCTLLVMWAFSGCLWV